MCGIAGVMMRNARALEAPVMDRLEAAIAHRGPDGSGRYMQGPVGLLNTRLAIIDVAGGNQPFTEPGGAVLVANGEIYNDLEIRRQIADAPYRTGSDCESPLHLYRRKGLAFTDDLRGMYGIAIYDGASQKLIIARDPFGIKQLYYVATPTCFAFASEAQALVAAGLAQCAVTPQARAELLQLKFTTGSQTIFAGIHRVLPGETLVVADGQVVERRRHQALPSARPAPASARHSMARLDALLGESVALHMRSDVPYGLFLSGGIDSSVLAALMSRISRDPVIALTAAFPGSGAADESQMALRVARAVGAKHETVSVAREDFWAYAPRLAGALDDPTTDAAALPTFMLGKAAKGTLKVVLCGEGADETFGGYGRYRRARWMWGFFHSKSRTRGAFSPFLGKEPAFGRWRDGLSATETSETGHGWTHMQRLQAVDCAQWLPNDLLVKLDRCLMAHGIEGRTPFLDSALSPFAFCLPDHLKIHGKMRKWLLREWLANNLPAAQPWAKKKGFNPPVGEWIAHYKTTLEPLVLAQPGIAEMAIGNVVRKVFADPAAHAQAAWGLVFYALWHSHHVLGVCAEGSAGDVLAAAVRRG